MEPKGHIKFNNNLGYKINASRLMNKCESKWSAYIEPTTAKIRRWSWIKIVTIIYFLHKNNNGGQFLVHRYYYNQKLNHK